MGVEFRSEEVYLDELEEGRGANEAAYVVGDKIHLVLRHDGRILCSFNHSLRGRYEVYAGPGVEGKEEKFKWE